MEAWDQKHFNSGEIPLAYFCFEFFKVTFGEILSERQKNAGNLKRPCKHIPPQGPQQTLRAGQWAAPGGVVLKRGWVPWSPRSRKPTGEQHSNHCSLLFWETRPFSV